MSIDIDLDDERFKNKSLKEIMKQMDKELPDDVKEMIERGELVIEDIEDEGDLELDDYIEMEEF